MISLSEFRRHYTGNYTGLTQMRFTCEHTLGPLYCAICHIPTQGLFFHLSTGFYLVHQLQQFYFSSFATPIAYSLLDITIIFVTLKKSNISWSFQPLADFFPFLYNKISWNSCLYSLSPISFLQYSLEHLRDFVLSTPSELYLLRSSWLMYC